MGVEEITAKCGRRLMGSGVAGEWCGEWPAGVAGTRAE
jgi:hypothetical protein